MMDDSKILEATDKVEMNLKETKTDVDKPDKSSVESVPSSNTQGQTKKPIKKYSEIQRQKMRSKARRAKKRKLEQMLRKQSVKQPGSPTRTTDLINLAKKLLAEAPVEAEKNSNDELIEESNEMSDDESEIDSNDYETDEISEEETRLNEASEEATNDIASDEDALDSTNEDKVSLNEEASLQTANRRAITERRKLRRNLKAKERRKKKRQEGRATSLQRKILRAAAALHTQVASTNCKHQLQTPNQVIKTYSRISPLRSIHKPKPKVLPPEEQQNTKLPPELDILNFI